VEEGVRKDALGDRMKQQYEDRTRFSLPRRTYTIIRVDGKSFHTFTRHCEKPFDSCLANSIDEAATALCEEAQGISFAYAQSDEVSFLLTDFALPTTDAWFDGNIQKIVSISSAVMTAEFNKSYRWRFLAFFDARVFTIPDPVEVENYFIWRQQDATRNSIQSVAQSKFSQKQLHGKKTSEMQEMLFQEHGINWDALEPYWKRGRCVVKDEQGWSVDREIPIFTQRREYLSSRIPRIQ
jgi:tRNA(His) 5'-end guanylyltransferase